MLAFLVTSDRTESRVLRLEQFLGKHGYTIVGKTTLDEVESDAALQAHRDSLVVVPGLGNETKVVEPIIRLAGKLAGRAFVVYVADEISQADYKALIRTGSGDCVGWDSAMREIVEISERMRSRPPETGRGGASAETPRVVASFVGTSGGSGNTMLALETAAGLAAARSKTGCRVAIVDLNFQRSVMADYLDLEPRLDIAQVLRDPKRLDRYMLDIFTSKHESTLDMFASASSAIDLCAIDGRVVFSLLEQITELYDVVVLDLPSWRVPWTDAIMKDSDLVFVTGLYSVPSVKQIIYELKRSSELELAPEQLCVVINQCRTNSFGSIVHESNIDNVLAGRRIFYVQQDWSFALECVNTGVSMVQSKRKRGICRDIGKIADAVLAVRAKVPA